MLATSTVFGTSLDELNRTSKEALMEINGIGEAMATAIINERKKASSNPLKIFRELKGLGEQTATNVKNDVKSSANVKKVEKTRTKKSSEKKDLMKKREDSRKKKQKIRLKEKLKHRRASEYYNPL